MKMRRSTLLSPAFLVAGALSLLSAPGAMAQIPAPFVEHFANNSAGWSLGTEWQIGPTFSGPSGTGNPDPAIDFTPTGDNGVAGMVIGGNVSTSLHPFYYLTSPAVDTTALAGVVQLSFRRWLNADSPPYMQARVEVFNGSSWIVLWENLGTSPIFDSSWTLQSFDITAYSNPQLRVRFGLSVGSAGVYTVSGWNVDEVTIESTVASPTVTTPTSALATTTGATLGGEVTSEGSAPVTARGVVYSRALTNPSPVIGGLGVTDVSTTGTTGTFTVDVTGLMAGTQYNFKAYATNAVGTGYTEVAAVFTLPGAPTVTAPVSTSLTAITATLGADVIGDGGSPVTARGVVYAPTAVNADPLIGGSGVTDAPAAGETGTFTVDVSGLNPATAYSFKAYATNAFGTGYTPAAGFTSLGVADLAGLTLSRGTLSPAFVASTLAYTASVARSVSSLRVTAVSAEPGAAIQVRVNGGAYQTVASGSPSAPLPLLLGANPVDVQATAQGGAPVKTYTIVVTRSASYAPGDAEPGFDPDPSGTVLSTAVQADGKIVVGGGFSTLGGVARASIARLHPDGTLDSGFNPGAAGGVFSTAVQADGKIVLGGDFTTVGGAAHHRIARVLPDGTIDASFGPSANFPVHSTVVQADGKILVGGQFSAQGWEEEPGELGNFIARLNTDGQLDAGFTPSVDNFVYSVALQADGRILIGGSFGVVGPAAHQGIARLNADGTEDTGFNASANDLVTSIALQADGKILLGGGFTSINGVPRNRIARLNPDGTLDTGFDPAADNWVFSVALQADGRILLGGDFTAIGGVTRNRIARLNADGTLDQGFAPDADNAVRNLAIQADGKVLVAGFFTEVGGAARHYIARLENDPAAGSLTVPSSSRIEWLRGGSSPEASRVTFEASTDGGTIYSPLGAATRIAGGWELMGLSLPASGHVRARARTASGTFNGSGGLVESIVAFGVPDAPEIAVTGNGTDIPDGDITPGAADHTDFGSANIEGGTVVRTFTITNGGTGNLTLGGVTLGGANATDFTVTGQPASPAAFGATFRVAFEPGTLGPRSATLSFANGDADENPFDFTIQGTGVVSSNADLADLLLSSGALEPAFTSANLAYTAVVGFGTTTLNVQPLRAEAHAIVQVRVNGGAYQTVGPGDASNPLALNAGANVVDVLVTAQDDVTTKTYTVTVVRAAPAPGDFDPDFNVIAGGVINTIAVQRDGKILLGGQDIGVSRRNADGTADTGFNVAGASNPVHSLAVLPDDKILVGGLALPSAFRLNSDGTVDPGFVANVNGSVFSTVVEPDGRILLGGQFSEVGGQARNNVARVNANGAVEPGLAPDVSGTVYSMALQADGKILLAGQFLSVDGQPRGNLARLNQDGTLDATFTLEVNGAVLSAVVQADGRILIGGSFSAVGAEPRSYLARLNPDGTLDAGFNPGANNPVVSMTLQADGRILMSGYFNEIGGTPRSYIARLHPDGTLDAGFNPVLDSVVWSVALQADGKILLGGQFSPGAVARLENDPAPQRLTIPSAARIEWLRAGASPESQRVTFELSTDGGASYSPLGAGTRIEGGWEITGLGLPGSGVIRARARTAAGGHTSSLLEAVSAIGVTTAPEVAVKGNGFDIADGDSTPSIADHTDFGPAGIPAEVVVRTFTITNTGSADLTLGAVTVSGPHSSDFTVTLQPVSPVVFSRTFQVAFDPSGVGLRSATLSFTNDDGDESPFEFSIQGSGFVPSSNADLSGLTPSSGTLVPAFAPATLGYSSGVPFSVSSLTVTPTADEGHATIEVRVNGGAYQAVASASASAPLSLNPGPNPVEVRVTAEDLITQKVYTVTVTRTPPVPGELDPDFSVAAFPLAGTYFTNTTVQPDGKILVGGAGGYISQGGTARLQVDGTVDPGTVTPLDSHARSTAVQSDGRAVIGGLFTSSVGEPHPYSARLTVDATLEPDFNPELDGGVQSISVQPDGKLVMGGAFTHVGGLLRNRVVRLHPDGMLDVLFNPNANNGVHSTVVQADGKILIGGLFTAVAGVPRNRIARLNSDGTLDTGFNPNANGAVLSIAVQADGRILLGGEFTTVGGQPRARVARLNANGALDPAFNPGANGPVRSMTLQANGKILLAGDFTTLGAVARNHIARLNADGTLDPVFNPDPNGLVFSTALQADGKILIGGPFTSVNGVTRLGIARLENSAATQSLTVPTESRVQWLRGGASPESHQVTFELSTDGGSVYEPLGPGTRISGGFELTGLSLPLTGHIRARARTTGGSGNGSSGLVETVTGFALGLPTVTSPTSAFVTATTATLGGDVTSDGGWPITERGVVYSQTSTNNNPLIGGTGVTKVTVIGTTGLFAAGVTGLSPSTGHSFKAFATNTAGTGYTSVATFTTACPVITLAGLPSGNVNAAYAGSVTASGGTGPYTYAVTSGALPGGLSLTASGAGAGNVGGNPTSAGTFSFDITATDASGTGTCTGVQSYSVVIDPELGQDFFTVTPCRVIDTRSAAGALGGPALVALADRTFVVAGTCGIPADAKAISVNIAVTGATSPGNIRLHPGGTAVPLVSSINFKAGQTRSNNGVVPLSALGELAAYLDQASGTAHLILDVNGYFK